MQKHKWSTEIKAWADGAVIEYKNASHPKWNKVDKPMWYTGVYNEYRIQDPYRELKEAHAAGKTIQRYNHVDGWIDLESPMWSLSVVNYRIKPEPEYVPFSFYENSHKLIGRKIKHMPSEGVYQIHSVTKTGIGIGDELISYKRLLEEFTFLSNHEPCGQKNFKS